MKLNKRRLFSYGSVLVSVILAVGVLLRVIGFPNQLIFYLAGAVLLITILVPLKASLEFQMVKQTLGRISIILTALFSIGLFILAPIIRMEPSKEYIIAAAVLLGYSFYHLAVFRKREKWQLEAMVLVMVAFSFFNAPFKSQTPNKLYNPKISNPRYEAGSGPIVHLDEAHHNFHTLDGLYWGFGEVMRQDGFRTESFHEEFSKKSLENVEILVIANALNEKNKTRWINPTYSAFTEQEQKAVKEWVENGGSLFLIADHMPSSGAAAGLASQFGFDFRNGFAMDTLGLEDLFTRETKTLVDNEITHPSGSRAVDSIVTFTGQAFLIPDGAEPILTFGQDYLQWEPDTAWRFDSTVPYNVEGYSQGAFLNYGKGKVVVFGEAMMFTSQLGWGLSFIKLGLSDPKAKNNQELLRNIIHWLDS